MNDLDLCLEVESRSCQPLRCIQCSLSRKPLEIVSWFQRTTNRKWPIGYQVWCEAVRSAILATACLLIFIFFCCFWCAIMPLTGVINYVCHFLLVVLLNQATISNGFRDNERCMQRNGWHDLDSTSKQRSRSFILVGLRIDSSYTTSYRLSIVTFFLGRTV